MILKYDKNRKPTEPLSGRRLLSVVDLARILGLRPQTIYNKMSQGRFPIKHKKIGRLIRFDSRELDKYLNSLPDHR